MHHQHAKAHAADNKQRLRAVLLLSAAYMVAEAIGGLVTNSLALLADAGHMLSDVAALGLSLFALWVARRPPTAQRTYGYYRAEILAALANGATLVAISIYVFIEAVHRFGAPREVRALLMMAIAAGGLLVNLIGLWFLDGGRSENLNVRGAWLHVLGDALGSAGALAAGALILTFGWQWADPVASMLIGLLVLYSAWNLLREAVAVLLEGAPGHIDVDELRDSIMASEGVLAVHDLHVWTIASGLVALSCHVVARDGSSRRALLESLNGLLDHRYGIHHTTVQIEPEDFGICETCR
jgi:cobalt-zinc-cadmium efflux system protein